MGMHDRDWYHEKRDHLNAGPPSRRKRVPRRRLPRYAQIAILIACLLLVARFIKHHASLF